MTCRPLVLHLVLALVPLQKYPIDFKIFQWKCPLQCPFKDEIPGLIQISFLTSLVCLYQLLLSILTSGPGVHHRVSGSRTQASPSPPLFRFPIGSYSPPLSDSGSSGPMQSVGAHKWSPPSVKRQSSGSPARRKSKFMLNTCRPDTLQRGALERLLECPLQDIDKEI